MLDTDYFKSILQLVGDAKYQGRKTNEVWQAVAEESDSDEDLYKFQYHMDEIWHAGLLRQRNGSNKGAWGFHRSLDGSVSIVAIPLVLTPIGSELLKELNKSKGLEAFKKAVRSAGSVAGSEALRAGVLALLG